MGKSIKNIIAAALGLLMLFTCSTSLAANLDDQKKVESITASAEKLFEEDKPVFEVDKTNFGLSDGESYSNAVLGEGVVYYVMSEDSLNGRQENADPFTMGGYIFPIKVGNKGAGIFKLKEINGELTIEGGASYLTFEQDLINAKNANKSKGDTKYIYDNIVNLYGLAVYNESGIDFIPIRDNKSFGLTSGQIRTFNEILPQVHLRYQELMRNTELAGGIGYSNTDASSKAAASTGGGNIKYVIIALSIVALGAGFIIIRKRKHVIE